MNEPFQYNKYVTGKNFIGREADCKTTANLLTQGEHIAIYEPPKSGKMSLIQQSVLNLRKSKILYTIGQFSCLNIRDIKTFLTKFLSAAIKPLADTQDQFELIAKDLLDSDNSCFSFDPEYYASTGEIIQINDTPSQDDLRLAAELPFLLAEKTGKNFILLIDEFQNIALMDKGNETYKALGDTIRDRAERKRQDKLKQDIAQKENLDIITNKEEQKGQFSFIFTGSMFNAMKEIFEKRTYFRKIVEHVKLHQVAETDIIEYINSGFRSSGKVVSTEILAGVCSLFKNNVWYINHFISVCDSLSRGYIFDKVFTDALGIMISIHEPRFASYVNSLTTYQLNMLRAIIDGTKKFSSAPIIEKYDLSSSANVKRLKNALEKKELVAFNEDDEPRILDPLFEYWIKRFFFEITDVEDGPKFQSDDYSW